MNSPWGSGETSFLGFPVRISPLAYRVRVWYTVEKHPILKRRRNYTVRRNEEQVPVCYILNQKEVILHPTQYQQLLRSLG